MRTPSEARTKGVLDLMAQRSSSDKPSAATQQEQAVIAAARLAVATYPIPYPGAGKSDVDYYMAKLRDALEALDADA